MRSNTNCVIDFPMSYRVKDYMDEKVPTVDKNTVVTEASKTLRESGKGYIIVLDEGYPAGIVTEKDFVNKVLAEELNPKKVTLKEIMSSPLISIDPEADLLQASHFMHENNIRRLPVVKDKIIYGVITSRQIAQSCGDYVDKSIRDILKWSFIT